MKTAGERGNGTSIGACAADDGGDFDMGAPMPSASASMTVTGRGRRGATNSSSTSSAAGTIAEPRSFQLSTNSNRTKRRISAAKQSLAALYMGAARIRAMALGEVRYVGVRRPVVRRQRWCAHRYARSNVRVWRGAKVQRNQGHKTVHYHVKPTLFWPTVRPPFGSCAAPYLHHRARLTVTGEDLLVSYCVQYN